MTPRLVLGGILAIAVAGAPAPASAQAEMLDRVRTLYVTAAYEEALAAMPPTSETTRTDVEQYRALCLLALGREREAAAVVERLVREHPTFVLAEETSPRLRALFDGARSKLVPSMARQAYDEAKAAFDAKSLDRAAAGFERTLSFIDSLTETERKALADLRQLASGFLDLAAPRPDPVPPLPPAARAPETKAASQEYQGPVPIREDLPVWTPPDSEAMRAEYVGLLQVSIGEDGTVRAASMVEASHPQYDAALVRAAQLWLYRPATRAGRPVPSFKNIQVRLVPR